MNKKIILLSIIPLFCFELVYANNFEVNGIDSIFNNFYGISFTDKDWENVKFSTEKIGMANPATVYCKELDYEYKIVDTDNGQKGICLFPDKSECEEWQFLTGKCGQSYSYCARQGYDLIIKTDDSREYAVCVHEGEEIGAITHLMNLREKASKGTFYIEENSSTAEEGIEENSSTAEEGIEENSSTAEEGVSIESLPSSFDWRNKDGQDWMTPVKDQGGCGSCWAFSGVGVVEAGYNIHQSDPTIDLDLSEDYLVCDCFPTASCCGISVSDWGQHLEFFRTDGNPDEDCLPYIDATGCTCDFGTCDTNCNQNTGGECSDVACGDRCFDWIHRSARLENTGSVSTNPTNIKTKLIETGPLSVVMGIENLQSPPGTIYRCTNDNHLDHAVIIVGYDDGGYWIVKNSWGIGWGNNGYFRVGYGECAIESMVRYTSDPYLHIPPFDRVIECDGDCRDEGTPDGICAARYGTQWHASSVDCEWVEIDESSGDWATWTRNFDQNLDWCVDGGGEDMTVTCTNVSGIDYRAVIIECWGDCRDKNFSPEGICQDIGSDWHAVGVDCDWINIDHVDDGDYTRTFDDVWGDEPNDPDGWCQDTDGEDMTVICSNQLIGKYKVRVIECDGDCRDEGTPNDICANAYDSNWRAIGVDCESIQIPDYDRDWDKVFNSNLNWCEDTGGEDLTITCVSSIAGDVDADCKVNILDLILVGNAFGSRPGDSHWNQDADLNQDGKINVIDLSTVGINFGNTC